MKKTFASAKQVRNDDSFFSKFSVKDILSPEAMNCIRGGDGGDGVIIIPPPPPPPKGE